MVEENSAALSKQMFLPVTQQNRPALPWGFKIKKKLKILTPYLGKFRPSVGQCCHQCTPLSLGKKLGQNFPFLGFQNLLSTNETHTRYRGWLVRRICCLLFVRECKVFPSLVSDRLDRVCQSNRVREALAAAGRAADARRPRGHAGLLAPYRPIINTCISPGLLRLVAWVLLKILGSLFCSIQINLNHLAALHKASQEGTVLVYVHMRQSLLDQVLISLVLFCHNLRVPYSLCPSQIHSPWLRSVLQKVGVVLLPSGPMTEQEAEADKLYSSVMTTLVHELVQEGQALSVGVARQSGLGAQWLARLLQVIRGGAVPNINLVPVGISYDAIPSGDTRLGLCSAVRCAWRLVRGAVGGVVRIHLAQPFSLKEMCDTGRFRVDLWRPLQDLLLPTILNNRMDAIFGQRMMSWVLPSHYAPELIQSDRDLSVALTLHLMYSTASGAALMATGLVSGLLLHRHRKGVCVSALSRDVAWLIEEVLFRNRDVGFAGTLMEVVRYALTLLAPHLVIATCLSRTDPWIVPRRAMAATLSLSGHAQIVTHTFIREAVGACAVSAMLRGVACSCAGGPPRADGAAGEEEGAGDWELDVALSQDELTERALQLCHLLPPGSVAPCQSSHSFALDAVDSLVCCGILVMEEVPSDIPTCDFWKRRGTFSWTATDDPHNSDSDCEERDPRSYKLSQPSNCPDMLFFLCSMLAGHLRALYWATDALSLLISPLPEAVCVARVHSYLCDRAERDRNHYESCSEEVASTAVRTLMDLGVLAEEMDEEEKDKEKRDGEKEVVFVGVTPLFQQADNRQKLQSFISQYLYD